MTKFDLNSFSLKGKNAIVTGGARGLGMYYTIALTMYGANVTIVSSSTQSWEYLKQMVNDYEGNIAFIQQDITKQGAAQKVVDEAVTTWGNIDILVNNAGVQIRNNVIDFKDEDWQKVIDINLNASYYMAHEVAKVMTKQQSGKIINIGSMQSYRAGKNIFPYAASKHGVVGITKAYADALAEYNIQVNALSPGYIRTDMTRVLEEDPVRGPEIKSHIPSGEWGVPENLMGPLIFLASEASDYVTGVSLPVDGGYLLR